MNFEDYHDMYLTCLWERFGIEFHECKTSDIQGVCVKAGTFCDHFITAH